MKQASHATAAQIAEVILTPMQTLYQPKKDIDPVKAQAQYVAVLSGFDVPTLAAGWREVVASHRGWLWPVPAAIVEACRKVQAAAKPDAASARDNRERAARLAADEAMLTPIGRRARAEGWSLSLWLFICRHGHIPSWDRMEPMIGAAGFRARWARGEISPEERAQPFAEQHLSFARTMAEKEAAHAARFAGQDLAGAA